MTHEKMSLLRAQMMKAMRIRGMGDKAQKAHIRAVRCLAGFLGRSPDTATPEELHTYQLHLTDTGVTPSTFNTRIVALRVSRAFATPLGRRCTPTLRDHLRTRGQCRRKKKTICGIVFPPNRLMQF